MCGDLNLMVDPLLDSNSATKGRVHSPRSLFHAEEVYDVWRCHYADKGDYTFYSFRHHTYSRIDLFIYDKWLLQRISSSYIHKISWSDHAMISV